MLDKPFGEPDRIVLPAIVRVDLEHVGDVQAGNWRPEWRDVVAIVEVTIGCANGAMNIDESVSQESSNAGLTRARWGRNSARTFFFDADISGSSIGR